MASENQPYSLVIVESPAKARTISRYLGSDYRIEASVGHVRDLPQGAKEIPEKYKSEAWAHLGVNVDKDFDPVYIVPADKAKQVKKLKQLVNGATKLYLATDEDREGEAISWHLCEILKPKIPVERLVFHEITKDAILASLESPRQIDNDLVHAQETRRIVDRLYGYEVSPLLWRKVRPKLSAGRVQSVAVRLIVDKERQRMAFCSANYWDITGLFKPGDQRSFSAWLYSVDGKRIATSRDFNPETGMLRNEGLTLLSEKDAKALIERLKSEPSKVTSIDEKPYVTKSPAPFTTSTLQQEANRKYGFTARRTMQTAQSLYENGYITYMRTDSTNLSTEAINAARALIANEYGPEYMPASPRLYQTKVKNAQEAHEAIRPAGKRFMMPEELRGRLNSDEMKLYDIIWKRTVACQMKDATGRRSTVMLQMDGAQFMATGKTIDFPGFLRAYVEGSDDPEGELADQEDILPKMTVGESVVCKDLQYKAHTTQPPVRYSEASLTRTLEEKGIGRPSTYASIIDTIIARNYVFKRGNALIPTWTAFAVTQLLEKHLPTLVDYQFTADMEDELDAISRGEMKSLDYLNDFYFGNKKEPGLKPQLDNKAEEIEARDISTISLGKPSDDEPEIDVRIGRFGPYIEQGDRRSSIPDDLPPDELTLEKAEELFSQNENSDSPLGMDPETGKPIYLKIGRYGPYVQLGSTDDPDKPRNVSLLKGMNPEDVNLDVAIRLLSLPRTLGVHPDDGNPIVASNGRFGPYIKWNDETRSLNDVYTPIDITLEQAIELLAQPKNRRGAPAKPKTLLKELAVSPVTEQMIQVMDGRYGPYVTDGQTNVSLPKEETPDTMTFEKALDLLAQRAARGDTRRRRKKSVKKTTTKKTTAKKTTAKKTTAKKTTAKKTTAKKSVAKKTTKKSE